MTTRVEKEALAAATRLFIKMGASEVFLFGSGFNGSLRPTSDIDLAVAGLPPRLYFAAASQAADLVGRPVDLLDLDEDTPFVRYLKDSGELVRVS